MSRNLDDLPPIASDDELMAWGRELISERVPSREVVVAATPAPAAGRRERPLVAQRQSSTMSTEELLLDISDRAAAVFSRSRAGINARQSALAGRTSTS